VSTGYFLFAFFMYPMKVDGILNSGAGMKEDVEGLLLFLYHLVTSWTSPSAFRAKATPENVVPTIDRNDKPSFVCQIGYPYEQRIGSVSPRLYPFSQPQLSQGL
jgi:hypothetical protein